MQYMISPRPKTAGASKPNPTATIVQKTILIKKLYDN